MGFSHGCVSPQFQSIDETFKFMIVVGLDYDKVLTNIVLCAIYISAKSFPAKSQFFAFTYQAFTKVKACATTFGLARMLTPKIPFTEALDTGTFTLRPYWKVCLLRGQFSFIRIHGARPR